MSEKSEMEIWCDQYLESSDNFYEKDGVSYWKIVHKDTFANHVVITVPWKALEGEKTSFYDENGIEIFLEAPAFFCFRGNGIPKWYQETATCAVSNISRPSDIGDYIGKAINR